MSCDSLTILLHWFNSHPVCILCIFKHTVCFLYENSLIQVNQVKIVVVSIFSSRGFSVPLRTSGSPHKPRTVLKYFPHYKCHMVLNSGWRNLEERVCRETSHFPRLIGWAEWHHRVDSPLKTILSHTASRNAKSSLTHKKPHSTLQAFGISQKLNKRHNVPRTGVAAHHLPREVSSLHSTLTVTWFLNWFIYNNYLILPRAKELKALFGSFLQKSDHSVTWQSKKSDKARYDGIMLL